MSCANLVDKRTGPARMSALWAFSHSLLIVFGLMSSLRADADNNLHCSFADDVRGDHFKLALDKSKNEMLLTYLYYTRGDRFTIRGQMKLVYRSEWSGYAAYNGKDSNGIASVSLPLQQPARELVLFAEFSDGCRSPDGDITGCQGVPEPVSAFLSCAQN